MKKYYDLKILLLDLKINTKNSLMFIRESLTEFSSIKVFFYLFSITVAF